MIYAIIRIILTIGLIAGSFAILRKKKWLNKRNRVVVIVVAMLFLTVSSILPVENSLITFSTAEKAFSYHLYGEIIGVAEGDNSCLIVYRTSKSSESKTIIPKTSDGYKIGTFLDSIQIAHHKAYAPISFFCYLYNARGTTDYYLYGYTSIEMNGRDDHIVITDSVGSNIERISERVNIGSVDSEKITFYAFIDEIPDDYHLIIDGVRQDIKF